MLRDLAARLDAERADLRESVSMLAEAERLLAESQGDEGGPGGQLADVASDLAEAEVEHSLVVHQRARLAAVEAALHRLAEGRFGLCEGCGAPIDPARLRALPWTPRCLDCAVAPSAG